MSKIVLTLTILLATSSLVLSQTPTTGGPEPDTTQATTEVPLDGGASLLLAGGVAYGLRKLRAQKRAS